MSVTILSACAGSGKTRRLVLDTLSAVEAAGHVVLVSMTNSVRLEIAERLQAAISASPRLADCEYTQASSHNHFAVVTATGGHGTAHVASIDGFVHTMLVAQGFEQQPDGTLLRGTRAVEVDNYEGKRRALQEVLGEGAVRTGLASLLRRPGVPMSGVSFLVDEFQDLDDLMVTIYAAVATHVALAGGAGMVVGDPWQNVFGRCEDAFARFREALPPRVAVREEELSVCFRCPAAHLRLVNRIFSARPTHPHHRTGTKPMVVAHSSTDVPAAARAVAATMASVIRANDLPLGQVCVLGSTTNHNALFGELEVCLNELLGDLHPGHSVVKWFLTGEAGGGIDWSQADDRIAMMSVHAMKGAARRYVVMCDVTEGKLPRWGISDHVQRSQLYVGLTRATEHLLLTFGAGSAEPLLFDGPTAQTCPSRYLCEAFATVDELLPYVTWSVHSTVAPHEVEWRGGAREWVEVRTCHRPATSCTEWAKRIPSARALNGDSIDVACTRFGGDVTGHEGLATVRQLSMEAAVGLLAQRRLRGCATPRGQPPVSPLGWLRLMDKSPDGMLQLALLTASLCAELNAPHDGKALWTLALVELAGVEDNVDAPVRPLALQLARDLWDPEVPARPGMDAVFRLCEQVDSNCRAAVAHLREAAGDAVPRFEIPLRVVVPDRRELLAGRVDLVWGSSVLEIKASTTEWDGSAALRTEWWNQVLLYAGMLDQPVDRVGVLDVTRGALFSMPLRNQQEVLRRARSGLG